MGVPQHPQDPIGCWRLGSPNAPECYGGSPTPQTSYRVLEVGVPQCSRVLWGFPNTPEIL